VSGAPAERVLAACRAAGVRVVLHRESVPTPTVETAAAALGVPPEAIVKTLVYIARDGAAVLAIARGLERIDARAVAAQVPGAGKLRMASPAEVLRATGYEAGGVPPVGHEPPPRAVVVDRAVLAREVVYGGGGEVAAMIEIAAADIVRMTGAVLAEIRRP
jgi:Cys-tRNA(Pro)/Cys-tRNA(Cys) deacylase